MRYINRGRGSGKTMSLIYSSYVTGYPIITRDGRRANNILEQAKSLGLDIRVYSLVEYIRLKEGSLFAKGLFIDEAADIIPTALEQMLGAPVIACTFTIPYQDIEKKEAAKDE